MRIIPKTAKVKIEFFKNVSLADTFIGLAALALEVLLSQPVNQWQGAVKNDFEPHIFEAHPAIAELKKALLDAGALYASMSGSGSAVFGIFDCEVELDFGEGVFVEMAKL